jgi:hypothetical protein
MNRGYVVDAATKPIGYWLKHLHNLIEAQFLAILDTARIGRRHWQVLNLLARGPHTAAAIAAALAPFLADGETDLGAVLTGLSARRWTVPDGDALALTAAGHTAHTAVAVKVEESRGILLNGLTGEQYTETVRVLCVMAENVEAALAA